MIKIEERAEENEVPREFDKAKAEGRQPLCAYCHEPLEIGQFYSVYVRWACNDQKKRYQQEDAKAEFGDEIS